MIPVLRPLPQQLVRALPIVLPLLALPALAIAQDAADPLNLGYESAVESHRGFEDEALVPDGRAAPDSMTAIPTEPGTGDGAKPAGERPMPIDPDAAEPSVAQELYEPSDEPSGTAEPERPATEPAMAAAEPGTAPGAKPAGEMPMPLDPDAAERSAARDGAPATPEPPQRAQALLFDSVLDDYAPYEESDGPNWVESNETVGEIGGWRTYARELYEPSDDEGGER